VPSVLDGTARSIRPPQHSSAPQNQEIQVSQLRTEAPPRPSTSPTRPETALGQLARRTFGALTPDQARAVLEPRPDPVATVRRSGPSPYRVLCFGGGALRGIGLQSHDVGLPGRIADKVAQQTRRGVQVDVVVQGDPTAPAALALLSGLRLRRYDAVIVLLGEGVTEYGSTERWRGAMVGLARLLQQETSDAAGVFIYDTATAQPRGAAAPLGRNDRRSRFTEVTREVCSFVDRVRFAELRLIIGGEETDVMSDDLGGDWADFIVTRMKSTFEGLAAAEAAASPRHFRNQPQNERFRQRAVDVLRLRRGDQDEQIVRELAGARAMYRSSTAALTVLDGDLQWVKAAAGDAQDRPRAASYCDFAIRTDDLTLINDTWLDPRSRAMPLAHGDDAVRFYAGFPVHSLDGYRIGMVCVFGDTPRSFRASDLEGLRDVAARIEQILWNDFLQAKRA
jgi:GAF domain-containing protein